MSDEQRSGLNLDDVPDGYTGLRKTARQLDLIIPHAHIPTVPGILPMDRMIRAVQSYISRLRDDQVRVEMDVGQAEIRTAPDTQVAPGSEPSGGIVKTGKNGTLSKPMKKKSKGRKEQKNARPSGDKTSEPEIQTKPKASNKRKFGPDSDTEEELDTKSSKKKKKKKKRKLSTPPIEQEVPEPEIKEPKEKSKKKEKHPKIPCSPTEDDVPTKVLPKKKKKDLCPPSDDIEPEPATQKRKKEMKKSSLLEEEEHSENPQTETDTLKRKKKKAKKESTRVDETSAHNTPEPQFNADASFLSEALETTEERNNSLTQEISSLKAILQAVGISGVKLSVALTRMRHGQSAEEIFSSIKKEGS
jgi:hypothetical protein